MTFAASILVKATVTLVLALLATRAARCGRAAVRHVFLAGAFAILLALPVASSIEPPIRFTVPVSAPRASIAIAETVATLMTSEPVRGAARVAAGPPHVEARISLATVLAAFWIAGALLFLARFAVGLCQTRAIRRTARPWRQGQAIADALARDREKRRTVNVMLHEAVPGPMTCGIGRPAIILPIDAPSWSDDDVRRAIAHELEHVARGDWFTQSVARAVAAAYWFHPLVRITWRQFALEAERACDDAVLRRAQATEYADQLVRSAQRMLDVGGSPFVAMASRNDLPSRVRALLDGGQRRGPAGAAWIAAACVASSALFVSMSAVRIVAADRTADQPSPQFDVASVKSCKDELSAEGERRQEWRTPSPGRITIACVTLERIIHLAYAGVAGGTSPLRNVHPITTGNLVRGGPGWIRSERFTIEAKADGAAGPVMMGPMLRALLEDRFQLQSHTGSENAPMYALTVARGGLKIKPIGDDGCTPQEAVRDVAPGERFKLLSGPKPICGTWASQGDGVNRTLYIGGNTMAGFASGALATAVDRFVIDRTGVSGRYNIRLTYGFDAGPNPAPSDIERGPSIFTALQEQLGLTLEGTRGARDFLVIDRVERPDPD